MDNPKIIVKSKARMGKGVYAKENIKKDEPLAEFDGKIYNYSYRRWNDDLSNHCIQFAPRQWRDSDVARLFNHSCEPNCGIKGLFTIVAMRNIKAGEELVWDYEMTENWPGWSMKCRCGSKSCRKVISCYDNMPQKVRDKYKGYISEWLLNEN